MTNGRWLLPCWSHNVPTGTLLATLLGVALAAAPSRPAVADTPAITSFASAEAHPASAHPASGHTASGHTAAEAKALAERAVAHIRAVGRDQAFADFSRPDGGFIDGDLYVFCHDVSGVVVAHGGNPQLVGRNMAGVRGPDGRLANVEINQLGLSQGSGWFEFRWPNPATKRIELKAAYVLKIGDHTVCGSGYYKGIPP
jgi:cytochrome c